MIRLAVKQAAKSNCLHKLGAVIVKNGRVLSVGYNEIRYSHFTKKGTVHAEEAAIIKLMQAKDFASLAGSTLYVTRVSPAGKTALSKPCSRCMELIKAVGIKKVVYTTNLQTAETIKC